MPDELKQIDIAKIQIDSDIQARVELDASTVTVYFERMMAGDTFPPITVFDDGQGLWLADGFHRVAAAKRATRQKIDAQILEGTHDDAAWHALGSNRANGLQMSTADKARAIKQALLLRPKESNRMIASHIGVNHVTVSKYRAELISTGEIIQLNKTVGADGKERPAQRPTDDDPPPSPPSTTVPTNDSPPVDDDLPPPTPDEPPPPSVDEPPPSTGNVPTDRVGNSLTDSDLVEIFNRDHELVELCTAVSRVKMTVLKAAEGNDPLYAAIHTGQFKADAENFRRQIDHIRPHAVCPYCKAIQPKRASCEACHGRGWVNAVIYKHAPSEKK